MQCMNTNFFSLLYILLSSSMEKAMSAAVKQQPKIAIIGAGAAGLSSARVLSRDGAVNPTVLEAEKKAGGVWIYKKEDNAKPMYRGLRTNLPKEVMAFREKRWDNVEASFVAHSDVAEYLDRYSKDYDLDKFIQYSSPVKQLTVLSSEQPSSLSPASETWPRVKLDYGRGESDIFDAVFVCNGHYAEPSSPEIPGLAQHFHGNVMHSASYDDPSKFQGQTVLCIGGRASGSDLAREISLVADRVYLSDTTCTLDGDGNAKKLGKVTWVPKTMQVLVDGSVVCDHDYMIKSKIDTIIFCSGYDYSFPFINKDSNLDLSFAPGERRVMPLYEQLWHAKYPNICFVGITHSVVPFPLFELQGEAVWSQLQSFSLPDQATRRDMAEKDSASGGVKENGRIQDTHFLGSFQWDYCRKMAQLAGIYNEDMEQFISTNKAIYDHAGNARKSIFPGGPDSYRKIRYERDAFSWSVKKN